jgi:(E)-4-hydroxy-3-methylbut-2-enyl-diphosphate synthase
MESCIVIDDAGWVTRRDCRKVLVGGRNDRRAVPIGGGAPISVQSMIKRKPDDVRGVIEDCLRLESAGCELIRLAVPDEETAGTLPLILSECSVPLIADIHFSARAALASVEAGIDKIRLNPGNIGRRSDVHAIARECAEAGVPIRVGVNSGSLPKDLLAKHRGERVAASVEAALRHIDMLRDVGFEEIVVAIKSSHTDEMIRANRLLGGLCDLPIHLGVTEAGCAWEGNIRSAAGIGTLLAEGIGDTIRVSLTDDPVEEVKTGFEILRTLGLREPGITFISCPTCGDRASRAIGASRQAAEGRAHGLRGERTRRGRRKRHLPSCGEGKRRYLPRRDGCPHNCGGGLR